MKLSIELENIIKDTSNSLNEDKIQPLSLSDHISRIEARKALEIEHFFRAVRLRLHLDKQQSKK